MQAGRRCSPSALAGSSVGGPGREGRCASVAGRPSRARRGGEHTDARRASCIGQMRAPAACVGARASVASNARPVTRPGLVNGCAVVGFAGRALGSQRGEHCCFARPVRLPVACEICGVMTAHEDSDSACGHGQLLGLLGGCCDRCLAQGGPDARTRAHSACGLGGANARAQRPWTRWRLARVPARRLIPGGGRLSTAAPRDHWSCGRGGPRANVSRSGRRDRVAVRAGRTVVRAPRIRTRMRDTIARTLARRRRIRLRSERVAG